MPISAQSPKICEIFIENDTNVNSNYAPGNDMEKQNKKLLSTNNNIMPTQITTLQQKATRRHSWSKRDSFLNRYDEERLSQFFKTNYLEDNFNTFTPLISNQLISYSCTDRIHLVKDRKATKSVSHLKIYLRSK